MKRHRKLMVLIIVAVLFLAVAVGTVIFFALGNESATDGYIERTRRELGARLEEAAEKEKNVLSADVSTEEITVWARKIYVNGDVRSVEDERQYDIYGNPIQKVWYDTEGNPKFWVEYYYNSSGNITREYWYGKSGLLSDSSDYEYDTAGNCVESFYYVHDGSMYRQTKWKYDDSGDLIEQLTYSRVGDFVSRKTFEYDIFGNTVKEIIYDGEGIVQEADICVYEYDAPARHSKRLIMIGRGISCAGMSMNMTAPAI